MKQNLTSNDRKMMQSVEGNAKSGRDADAEAVKTALNKLVFRGPRPHNYGDNIRRWCSCWPGRLPPRTRNIDNCSPIAAEGHVLVSVPVVLADRAFPAWIRGRIPTMLTVRSSGEAAVRCHGSKTQRLSVAG